MQGRNNYENSVFLIIPNHSMVSCALTLIARVLGLLLVFTPLTQLI